MKLKAILAAITLFPGTALWASAQIQPGSAAPITMETNLDVRASFETLGQRAGINVVAPYGAVDTRTPVSFKVENKSVTEALDLLAKQTNTFWTGWDSKTILVFQDTPGNRRDYDRQYLQRILPDGAPTLALQQLQGTHQIRGIVIENAIILRETLARISLAQSTLGKSSTAVGSRDVQALYLTEAGTRYRTPESVRSQLKIRIPGPVSLQVNENVRTTYETLARISGINVMFGRNFPTRTHSLRIDGVDYFDALDLLAIETRTFWEPVNETTIMVFDETQQNRRDFGRVLVEIIYLSPAISTQRLNEIMNHLRGLLSLRGVYQHDLAKAIVIKDTAGNTELAEALIEEMSGPIIRREIGAGILDGFTEAGGPYRTPAEVRSKLQTKVAGRISLQMSGSVEQIYGNLAAMAGVALLPPAIARNLTFEVKDQDIFDALDLLAQQSSTFWMPLDSRTIQVVEDTQQNRRDYDRLVARTIYLPPTTSTNELNLIMNVLRTSLSMRGIYQYEGAKAILVRDTPGRVALTERLIRHLNVREGEVTSVSLSAPGLTETGIRGSASVARPMLRTTPGLISVNMNQDVRQSYEALARMAGLTVSFDPRVAAVGAVRFNVSGVDALDALDYLSFQTRTFWKVVDDHTILVAPDTPQAHTELDARLGKVFYLTNANVTAATIGIVNALRTALSLRQVFEQAGTGAIEMWDTPQRLAFVEQVIASLDKVR
jgi:hypothetical protein